jgi:ribonuclease P protein component
LISNIKFTLGKDERLKSRKLIERVFRDGKSFALFPFRVYYLSVPAEGQPPLQAGFGAGARNFKKAVDRNRIKRLAREGYRLQKQELAALLTEKGQALAIFFIYTGKELPDTTIVSGKIALALQKLIKETGR